jgi:hypothetical protein
MPFDKTKRWMSLVEGKVDYLPDEDGGTLVFRDNDGKEQRVTGPVVKGLGDFVDVMVMRCVSCGVMR